MFYDTKTNNHGLAYNPFKAIVSPRPIAWVSSADKSGNANLAPYSFFNGVSALPPMIGFSSAEKPSKPPQEKDSLRNIRETGEFCVNIVSYDLRDAMNITSGAYDYGEDEFALAGLTKGRSRLIKAPYVEQSPVVMECTLFSTTPLPGGNTWVMGHVVGIHIDEQHIKDGLLDVTSYQPLARLGYKDYAVITELFSLERPK